MRYAGVNERGTFALITLNEVSTKNFDPLRKEFPYFILFFVTLPQENLLVEEEEEEETEGKNENKKQA